MAYFEPLRRKLGVITLGLACAITCLWFRSPFVYHTLNIPIRANNYLHIGSVNQRLAVGSVALDRVGGQREGKVTLWLSGMSADGRMVFEVGNATMTSGDGRELFAWQEFHPIVRTDGGEECHINYLAATFPYWLVVLPLTLLSAWLLFSKQRSNLQPKPKGP